MGLDDVYGCFRCGQLGGEFTKVGLNSFKCGGCGEFSVVSFKTALDLLNEKWIQGELIINGDIHFDETLEDLTME